MRPVTGPVPHGQRQGYTLWKCRCSFCREANRLYMAEVRERYRQGTPKTHGLSAYNNSNCRCDICKAAKSRDNATRPYQQRSVVHIQTFLPYSDFSQSARVLDRLRLGKQRLEAFQIMEVLSGKRSSYTHHPAVQMWKGSEFKLMSYAVAMCVEWVNQGYEDNMRSRIVELGEDAMRADVWRAGVHDQTPYWLGWELFHRSHRSQLLKKDREHYSQFWPEEDPTLDYIWPPPRPLVTD